MSHPSKPKTKEAATARAEGQMLLPLSKKSETGRIAEPHRSECVELLRLMLQSAIDETRSSSKGNE